MQIYFKSRSQARAAIPSGKLVDNGAQAPKRWAKDISNIANKKLIDKLVSVGYLDLRAA